MKNINGLIPAAGKSFRMKEDKALLEIAGKHNICRIIGLMEYFTDKIAVVTSQNYENVKKVIKKDKTIILKNEKAYLGMFSSVKIGVSYLKESDFILLHPVDNMFVPKEVYEIMTGHLNSDYDFIKPYYQDENANKKGGHPLVITKSGIEKILNAKIEENLRVIVRASKVRYVRVPYKEILFNVNTKEDLKKYLEYVNGNNQN